MARPKSGLTRQELQAKSDQKRGVRLKSFKFHESVIAQLERLAAETGLSQTQVIVLALAAFERDKNPM